MSAVKGIKMKPVISSNISSVGYDDATQTLQVTFLNGASYQYKKVPKAVYLEMMATNSKGKFYASNIKAAYEWVKL